MISKTLTCDFRRQAASAVMHPVTLAALGVLLVNDLVFKALWPGAWIPGKLSDLAWLTFAHPVLAYVLSFATMGGRRAQRAAFAAAYAGLPLLYAAFNTFQPVHDAILKVLGFVGGEGPRSPLDPTDSLVIPIAMATALWVWHRPPLESDNIRARLALLAATVASLASVATSYDTEWGVRNVGRTASGTLGAHISADYPASVGTYESIDGGLSWTKTSEDYVPLERQDWRELEVVESSGAVFIVDGARAQIIREWSEIEVMEPPSGVFWAEDGYITAYGELGSREVVFSYEYLRNGGNSWVQALDKRGIENRVIATTEHDLFYDDQSGNLIVAMGLQGVVVVTQDGTSMRVAVGPYSPTDFSWGNKVGTFFSSLLLWETAQFTGIAVLLTFSFATLALPVSKGPRACFAFAAAISAFLAVSVGVYPHVLQYPWQADGGMPLLGSFVLLLSGFGLFPLLLVIAGLALARPGRRQLLVVGAASIGMLSLVTLGALVLFETGTGMANLVAVGLVGLATLGLWAYMKRMQTQANLRSQSLGDDS